MIMHVEVPCGCSSGLTQGALSEKGHVVEGEEGLAPLDGAPGYKVTGIQRSHSTFG